MDIKEQVRKLESKLIEIRRYFHENPELGNEEVLTMEKIMLSLNEWGIPFEKKNAGIVAIICGDKPGKTVGVRADIDALPIQELVDIPYKSKIDGMMHACGHEVHATVLLGVGAVLNQMKAEFSGNVKLFFQPAEETTGGAERMIEEGCLKNPDVDYVIGLHVSHDIDTGQIQMKRGKLCGASDMFTITVDGYSSHGASPHLGLDAIVAASGIVQALQPLISRRLSPFDPAVLTIGSIHGGTGRNIIANQVVMQGISRTLDPLTRKAMENRIRETVEKTAQAYGVTARLDVEHSYCALINSDEIFDVIEAVAKEAIGAENIFAKEFPSLGVEDFAYFAEAVPSCFFHLGCKNEAENCTGPAHNGIFKVDEGCIVVGVELQVKNVLALLSQI